MKWLRAIGSLALLLGVLVGVPWLLAVCTNPAMLLSVNWGQVMLRPDDGRILLELLGLVGWASWLVLAATIIVEVVAVTTRRRIDFQVPGTAWFRPVVATLVAAVVLAPSTMASAAPAQPASPTTAAGVTTVRLPQEGAGVAEDGAEDAGEGTPAHSTGRSYTVQPGDELWTVAERQLGSGQRWRDLLVVNPGLTADSRLEAGSTVQLPPDVMVCKGDSLWLLAQRHLGDGNRWPEIYDLNADLIDDPDEIDVGWKLLLPADETLPVPPRVPSVPKPAPKPVTPPKPAVPAPVPPAPTSPSVDAAADEATENNQDSASPSPSEVATSAPAPSGQAHSANAPERQHASAWHEMEPVAALNDESAPLAGAIGGVLASTIIVSVAARRRLQLIGRAVGRRLIPLSPEAETFWTALARRAETAPEVSTEHSPTSVVLGWRDDGSEVTLCLETARATGIVQAPQPQAVIGAMLTSLLCAPWSTDVEVLLVGADQPWSEAVDDPRLTQLSAEEACEHLTRLCATRRLELGTRLLNDVRADPDQAPAWRPVVALFASPLSTNQLQVLSAALNFGQVGVSLVVPQWEHSTAIHFSGDTATLDDVSFSPQLLTTPARRALVELFASTINERTEPAPWWNPEAPRRALDADATVQEPRHPDLEPPPTGEPIPSLVLLGEPNIEHTPGEPPRRARQQCIEYAAWLLLHPDSTPTSMARSLCVAESTRRSNLSRLRTWLGTDTQGQRFLPDAYQGRISLDERVTSDWHRLRALVTGPVNEAGDRALRCVLSMVSAPPLGTAVERWPWARCLYDDMVSFLVDVACELADRCLASGFLDEALWAVQQGQLVAPKHDELCVRLIRVRRLLGDAQATHEAIDVFRSNIREDNRPMHAHHAAELTQPLCLAEDANSLVPAKTADLIP